MTARQLLADLRARGIELKARGDRLRWRPRRALTEADRQALADHKAELLALLAEVQPLTPVPEGQSPSPGRPREKGVAIAWAAELAELVSWFSASADCLPREPFGLVPGQRNGWAVWVSDPVRFYSALARDIAAGPQGPAARTGSLAVTLCRLRGVVESSPNAIDEQIRSPFQEKQ